MAFVIKGKTLKKYTEEPGVEKVVIPDGITKIAPMAMSFCDHVKEIAVPEDVTWIENGCFAHSKALEKVTLPESLTIMEEGVFSGCTKLKSVNIPGSLERIGDHMFFECTSLKELVIPEGIKAIGQNSFSGCKSLKKVVLPNSLRIIETYAFLGCTRLQEINIRDGVVLEEGAFEGCKSLNKEAEFVILQDELCGYNGDGNRVYIPDHVKVIGRSVFAYNKMIKEVYIPDSVEKLEGRAFERCVNLKRIRLPYKIAKIESAMFWDCKALEKVEVPEGIIRIEKNAFRHCYSLKTIRLPFSLKIIEEKAFSGTLGSSITNFSTEVIAPGTNVDDIMSPEDKFSAAVGFINNAELYKDTVVQSYYTYISKKRKELLPIVWKNDMAKALQVFADSGLLTNKTYEEYLSEAHSNNAIQCVAFLMSWKNGVNTGVIHEKKPKSYMDKLMDTIKNTSTE